MRLLPLPLVLVLAACGRADDARPGAAAGLRDAGPIDAGQVDAGGAAALRVFEEGREPRAVTTFAFDTGRAEAAVLELHSRMTRGGDALGEERVTLRLGVRYPARDTVELTVRGAETTSPAVTKLGSTAGARFTQAFDGAGKTDAPMATWPPGADPRAAGYLEGTLAQLGSSLLPVLPAAPVGEGARWAVADLRFELLSRTGDALTVERRSGLHGPQRLGTGETVLVSEEQTYRMEARPDGIARRVEALLVAAQPTGATLTTRLTFDVQP